MTEYENTNRGIYPMETGNLLTMIKEATKNGSIVISWDDYDKSFNDFADGFKASGSLVFGYLDGNNKFYPANSMNNVFDSHDRTGSIKIISYNPQHILKKFNFNGYNNNTGEIIFDLDTN